VAKNRVVIIGAGIGGLAAAVDLSARGIEVVVVDKADAPGGKLQQVQIGDMRLDAGPTVFTLRHIFDELFAAAGTSLDQHLTLTRAETLARHVWSDGNRLDLFADEARSAAAIAEFAGADEAQRYRAFSAETRRIYTMLDKPFLRSPRPGPVGLTRALAAQRISDLWHLKPFTHMWQALQKNFRNPRLRQLFGRYATYCGSSPFLAPATLMLIAHVERDGIWLVQGGMHRLAVALENVATKHGAIFRYGTAVSEALLKHGDAAGVRLANGEIIGADAVICNADTAAVATGLLGDGIKPAVPKLDATRRSLSAITWNLLATTSGFPLLHHSVFFSDDYAAEFTQLFSQRRLPDAPTVYVCAQDRDDHTGIAPNHPERLLCLVNAPATGDTHSFAALEIEQCEARTFNFLSRCGVQIQPSPNQRIVTTPTDFHRLFPATGGALYGQASHGWRASFQRPMSRTVIKGLYLAGGSTHPGAGVPMAALSGRLAAASLLQDFASTHRSHITATPGGISTRSVMTDTTGSPSSLS
jgi:1-hydroxycarotenoid 3,4-desaturase